MEILKLEAAFKDYLWGGRKLVSEYGKKCDFDKVAESWELSNHKDGSSIITNGSHANELFRDYLENNDKKLWGTNCAKFDNFPVLIKFIDAKQALSIQVHPDDEYALKYEHEYGKNEFWYILECEPNSFLYYGVKEDMSKEEYRSYIENDTICDHLNKVMVNKGDCFYIKAGTIHAIGAGIVICEIQQCSNTTYRVYDFGRVGTDGKPRPLHIDKAVEVSNLKVSEKNGEADGKPVQHDGYVECDLTHNEYFKCDKYDVNDSLKMNADVSSFNSLIFLEGEGTISGNGQELTFKKGESFFIPAGFGEYTIKGKASLIKTYF